jgi:hypothetical protein
MDGHYKKAKETPGIGKENITHISNSTEIKLKQ